MIHFELSWSHLLNYDARKEKLVIMACPSCGLHVQHPNSTQWYRVKGNYAVNYGNTNYGQTEKGGVPFLGAPFATKKSSNFKDIADGLSHTLLMAEVISTLDGPSEGGGYGEGAWWGPISETSGAFGGQTFEGWLTPNSLSPDQAVRACPPVNGLNGISGCTLIGDYYDSGNQVFASRSHHPGGVNTSLCDGSVQFFSDDIDWSAWQALSSSKGGEILPEDGFQP